MNFLVLIIILTALLSSCSSNPFGRDYSAARPQGDPNDDYYKLLNLDRTASEKDIKKSFRKQAMRFHPDKGGDAEDFKALNEAYEVLSDPQKRSSYDRHGKAGSNVHADQFTDLGDLFREFGAGFGGGGFDMKLPRIYNIELSLEYFYTGKKSTIKLGSSAFALNIEPGMYGGLEMRAQVQDGYGVQNVIFVLKEKEHQTFTRKNADLLVETTISLHEAVNGFERRITFLDGNTYTIHAKGGEVNGADDGLLIVKDLGMPVYKTGTKGRLFVSIKLDFPSSNFLEQRLTAEDKQEFNRILKLLCDNEDEYTGGNSEYSMLGRKGTLREFGKVGAGIDRQDTFQQDSAFRSFFF